MTNHDQKGDKDRAEGPALGEQPRVVRHPPWLKVRMTQGKSYARIKGLLKRHALHTVCEEAHCPNIWECWNRGTATFMILGDICTRRCGFCAVNTGKPTGLDTDEPQRVAKAVAALGLRYAVITSVNRDDLPDGGAGIFAKTVQAVRQQLPDCYIEVLIPDFRGSAQALKHVTDAAPDVLAHNVETVPRLYRPVRPAAKYAQSLEVLNRAKGWGMVTKTGLMLGLGEELEEVIQVIRDVRDTDCDILTLGQYLRPSHDHLEVVRYYHPDEFAYLKEVGISLGFRHVESGPLVRSSYHAETQAEELFAGCVNPQVGSSR